MKNKANYIETEILERATEIAADDVENWTDSEVAEFLVIDEIEVDQNARAEAVELWAEELAVLLKEQMAFEEETDFDF